MNIIFVWNLSEGVASLESLRSSGLHIMVRAWFGHGSGCVSFSVFSIFIHFLAHCGSGVVRARFGFAAFAPTMTFQPISSKVFPQWQAQLPARLFFYILHTLSGCISSFFVFWLQRHHPPMEFWKNMCFATVSVRNHCKWPILGTMALKHMFDCAATLLL